MHGITNTALAGGRLFWQIHSGPREYRHVDGVFIGFPFGIRLRKRRALEVIADWVERGYIHWLQTRRGVWRLDLDGLRESIEPWETASDWMTGVVHVSPEVETEGRHILGEDREETSVQFIITREEIELSRNTRVFLSYKRVDKPLVRRIHDLLQLLGFDPWLDDSDMNAGAELERALLKGMEDSCAAVFFVTPAYQDEDYLATEVDYAIAQKRKKGDRFSIITLLLRDANGKSPTVPALLQKYLWKEPQTELAMLEEIIRGLPVVVAAVQWRDESPG